MTFGENLEVLVFRGVPAGFFFRYGLTLMQDGNQLGVLITAVAFIVGALVVFPVRPFWQPVLAVAAGFGLAELAAALGS